jgi:hypothetical protein
LKCLEEEGIDLGSDFGTVKGTVASILDNNLGSHFVGGFTECFSGAGHFCRFCLATSSIALHDKSF